MEVWTMWMIPFCLFLWLAYKKQDNNKVFGACALAALTCLLMSIAS